jgi:DNA-binding winged helix-turn-helix (wHTH) protein
VRLPLPEPLRPNAFRVGDWLVEPDLGRVSRDDTGRQLEPRIMHVLVCLAERCGEVVARHELVDAVWAMEFITENTLTHAIAELRKLFGDNARDPRYIETITKRGYRLIMPVEGLVKRHPHPPGAHLDCGLVLEGHRTTLAAGENLIGRATDVAVHIDSVEVSRHHARIRVGADQATLEDLGSKNGTYLWGRCVTTPVRLEDGDEISIGPALLVFATLRTTDTTQTARSGREE